jgi:prepilin signal peptidase PulO-like enzyme (type II secretory pathway)
MLAIIVVTGRARSVPMAGYVIDLLGGAVAGAGSFSLLAWIYNLIMRPK